MAAVLAAGPGAVLSHRSAAALWGIRDTARADIDVNAPAERRRPGIDVHRIVLPADEVTVARGIPVTTPAARSSTSPHSPSPPSSHATRDAGERRH